ncbi:hypothetical protein KBD71_04360 [Candidatus Woesebacteria bacterium]|nr:hypothetical protein [Candidatus Woesebacteria bacterium]
MFKVNDWHFKKSTPHGMIAFQKIDTAIQLILFEAEKLGIKWKIVDETDVIELTYKNETKYFRNRAPSTTHIPAAKICENKVSTKAFLKRNYVSVTNGFVIHASDNENLKKEIWESLVKPVVIKPTHGTHGDNVSVDITSYDEYLNIISSYFYKPRYEGGLLIEEMFVGSEYRIMATSSKVIAVLERVPASVVGDGTHSISELITIKNSDPFRNISPDVYPHIEIDDDIRQNISEQHKDINSPLIKGEKIFLRKVSNVMAGGDTVDRTDQVHESVKNIAVNVIQSIPGLSWGGIDFLSKNIFQLQDSDSYRIIEVNSAPEFDMHYFPMEGQPRPVALEFLKLMFPEIN